MRPKPSTGPVERRRRALLQASDQLLDQVEELRLRDYLSVPAQVRSAIRDLQVSAGRGEAAAAPANLRAAHQLVLAVQHRLMAANPNNVTPRVHPGRGPGQATVKALAGGGTWKLLALPGQAAQSRDEWLGQVAATVERALDRWVYAQHHAARAAREHLGVQQALGRARTAWQNYWELHQEAERLTASGP